MKRITAGCCLVLALALCGCSSAVSKKPTYVYALGFDTDADTVVLTALCCEGTSFGSAGGDGTERDAEQTEGHTLTRYHFGGKTVGEAFDKLHETCRGLYTGTLCVYVLSEELSDKRRQELAVYLLNAPSIPLRAGCLETADADAALGAFAAAYTDRDIAEALDGRYENVIALLVVRCADAAA